MELVPMIRLFGYGSLLNEENVRSRLGDREFAFQPGMLIGYQRSFTKWGRSHVYLTLRLDDEMLVEGVLIDVDPIGLAILTRHESGYDLVDVTSHVADSSVYSPHVYCFIGESLKAIPPEIAKIRGSYVRTCLGGVAPDKHRQWIFETHIPEGVTIVAED